MRHFYTHHKDLLFAVLIAAFGAVLVVVFPAFRWPVRTVVVLTTALVLPGYVLSLVFFPGRSGLDAVQRLALSLGLSVVSVVGVGLALHHSRWGIQTAPTALTLAGLVLVLSVLAWARRRAVGVDAFRVPLGARHLVVGLAGLSLAGLLLGWLTPEGVATEFYVLGSEGRLEGYPQTVSAGEELSLTVGVLNEESRRRDYTVRVVSVPLLADEGEGDAVGAVQIPVSPDRLPTLAPGEGWEGTMTLTAPTEPGDHLLTLRLYRERDRAPYRLLSLNVTVTPPERSQLGAAQRTE